MTYQSQRPQCPSVSPRVLLRLFSVYSQRCIQLGLDKKKNPDFFRDFLDLKKIFRKCEDFLEIVRSL